MIRVERTKKCEHADNNVKAEDMKPSRERMEKGVEVNDDGKLAFPLFLGDLTV